MAKTGLLILTQPLHVTKKRVPLYLKEMNRFIDKSLYIHIQPTCITAPVDFTKFQLLTMPFTSEIRKLVKEFYISSADICSKLDVRVLLGHFKNDTRTVLPYKLLNPLEIVFVDSCTKVDENFIKAPFQGSLRQCFNQSSDVIKFFDSIPELIEKNQKLDFKEKYMGPISEKSTEPVTKCTKNSNEELKETVQMSDSIDSGQEKVVQTYNHVVLGGTFDRLHTGHKLLLTEGCLLSTNVLTVGVTDKEMNAKMGVANLIHAAGQGLTISEKTLCELLEPVDVRIKVLEEFVKEMKPSLEYRIVPIYDGFGPTILPSEPERDLIVLSQETKKGGEMINTEREKRGLKPLLEYVIDLIEDTCHNQYEEEKVSSSSQRKRLLGTLYNPLKAGVTGTERPFIIGLTGGIASGKSAICKRLEGLGSVTIDCDKLGHKAYLKGTPGFDKVVSAFGEEIVGDDGEINRKTLGAKVFTDKSQLDKLNALIWPEIANLAQTEVQKHAEAGKSVVVLDAAVLLEAGWDDMVHEVWVTIIPPAEAIKRMGERNNLSEEQARQRLESQLSNFERVQKSNVILSSLWEPEYTQSQVEKAWSLLQERLGEKSATS